MAQSLVPPTAGLSALGESAEKAALEMQTKLNISALPVRQYLESSVVPILLQGLQTLVKVRLFVSRCNYPVFFSVNRFFLFQTFSCMESLKQ